MKNLSQLKEHAESLINDFNNTDKYLLMEDVKPYKNSLNKLLGGDIVVILTDSYGGAGILTPSEILHEVLEVYINSLEPESEEEMQEWTEQTRIINLLDL